MATSLNKKSFIMLILKELRVIILVIAIAYFGIYELRKLIDNVNDNIYATNETNSLREFYKNTYDTMYKQLGNIGDAKRIITSALPPTEDIREFLGTLETFGKKHSVEVQTNVGAAQFDSISYEEIALRTVAVTMNVRGPLENVRAYIKDIEALPYFFTVTNIDERSIDVLGKDRSTTIQGKLWTKPEQLLTRMQMQ